MERASHQSNPASRVRAKLAVQVGAGHARTDSHIHTLHSFSAHTHTRTNIHIIYTTHTHARVDGAHIVCVTHFLLHGPHARVRRLVATCSSCSGGRPQHSLEDIQELLGANLETLWQPFASIRHHEKSPLPPCWCLPGYLVLWMGWTTRALAATHLSLDSLPPGLWPGIRAAVDGKKRQIILRHSFFP